MALKPFRRIHTTDPEITLLQDAIKDSIDSLNADPVTGGNILTSVTFASGDNLISHGLGRNYVCVFVGVPSAACTFVEKTSPDRSKYVKLNASAPCSAAVQVL